MSALAQSPAVSSLHILCGDATDPVTQAWKEAGGVSLTVHDTQESLLTGLRANSNGIAVIEDGQDFDLTDCVANVASLRPSVPTLVIGNNLPVSAVRLLMGIQYWDILDRASTFEALQQALLRAHEGFLSRIAESQKPKTALCWSFVSSVGGAGSTLIAVETAFQLAQRKPDAKIVVFDLNFVDGSCATYLNCEANLSPSIFLKRPEQIDDVFLQTVTTSHPYGIDVIAMPRWTKSDIAPSKAAILQCLNIACENYDYVIIDSPRWPTAWSDDIYLGSDEVLLVSELTVPALNASRQWVEQFMDHKEVPSIRPVLNRRQKGLFGAKVTEEQAVSALRTSVFASVRSDWPTALSAVNLGKTVGDLKPGSPIPKDVIELITKLEDVSQALPLPQTMKAVS